MEERLEKEFLGEIQLKCEYALICYRNIVNLNLDRNAGNTSQLNPLERCVYLFERLTSFLQHTSTISLVFFPLLPNGRKKEAKLLTMEARGLHLRKLFSIGPDHPLENREMRHNLAHSDERVESWWEKTTTGSSLRINVGPITSTVLSEDIERKINYFEWYDPVKKLFIFRGDTYDIGATVSVLTKIKETADTMVGHCLLSGKL